MSKNALTDESATRVFKLLDLLQVRVDRLQFQDNKIGNNVREQVQEELKK